MVNNTSKLEKIDVKEKPSAWEGIYYFNKPYTQSLER
jgi:hypothetical protein